MAINRKKPIIIRFSAGNVIDEYGKKGNAIYSRDFVIHCDQSVENGATEKREYGVTFDYDKYIIVNANSTTRNINQETIFFVNEMPTRNFPYGDYSFAGKSEEVCGNFKIYLKKNNNNNIPMLYYMHRSGVVCSFQLNFDAKEMVAYVPKNKFVPFDEDTLIWKKQPNVEDEDENRIVLKNKEIVGYTPTAKSHIKMTFDDYAEL